MCSSYDLFFLCFCDFIFLRHSRLTVLRFIAYYRSARAGLQDRVRLLRWPERSAGALRRWREHSRGQVNWDSSRARNVGGTCHSPPYTGLEQLVTRAANLQAERHADSNATVENLSSGSFRSGMEGLAHSRSREPNPDYSGAMSLLKEHGGASRP